MDEIETKVSEYVALTREAAEVKDKIETLKGWFEARGVSDLDATKVKTVDYWGENGKVEVGRSETVTAVSLQLLQPLFGSAYSDLVKPKASLELTAPCKQLLAPIALGNYIDTPMEDIIRQATDDEKAREALRKKVRGNFKSDKTAFTKIAGIAEADAEYYAYMAAESAAYTQLVVLLAAAGYKGTVKDAAAVIRTAVVVEEGVKVTVDAPKE